MKFARLPLCAGIAIVLTIIFVVLLTKLGGPRMRESLDVAKWLGQIAHELERHEALEAQGQPVFRRTVEKRRIVQELLAHRLTLREAAGKFRALNEEVRQTQPASAPTLAPQNEETTCRNVITWVRAELHDEPELAEEVTSELERELCEDILAQE